MTTAIALPVISGHEIAIDEHGRYNLNALHKASGESANKRPANWSRTDQAKELIGALQDQCSDMSFAPIESFHGGSHPGTFAVEEIAVAYAAWINAKFQLLVIRTFIDYRTGRLTQIKEREACTLTHQHQRDLQKEISKRVYASVKPEHRRKAFPAIYRHLKDRFGVASYKDIPESKYTQALAAVESAPLEGVYIGHSEQPVHADGIWLDRIAVNRIHCLCCHFDAIHRIFWEYDIYGASKALGSPVGVKMIDHIKDGTSPSHHLQRLISGTSRYDQPRIS